MKKYIFTESQIKKIIDNQIYESIQLNEQPGTMLGDQKAAIDAGTRDFLTNVKHIQGTDLTNMIMQYQKSIGMGPTGHMTDCGTLMPKADRDAWAAHIDQNKPIYDKISDWLHKWFNITSGSGYGSQRQY